MRQANLMRVGASRTWYFEFATRVCAFVVWASDHYTVTGFEAELGFGQLATGFVVQVSGCFGILMLTLLITFFDYLSQWSCDFAAKMDCQRNILWPLKLLRPATLMPATRSF